MMRDAFLSLDDSTIAALVQANGPANWAVALGGTRRAFLADGGALSSQQDLETYFMWSERAQRAVLDQLFRLGIDTIIAVARIPADRGSTYRHLVQRSLRLLLSSPQRRAFYEDRRLRVAFAGDLPTLAAALDDPSFADDARALAADTSTAAGPRLIYLFRGAWTDPATEEATWGYQLGRTLGRAPTRSELVQAFYGADIPRLHAFVGSGRPQLTTLRPPFLGGGEDLYWAHTSPIRLQREDWLRLLHDHMYARRTQGNRNYQLDPDAHSALADTLAARDGQIIGVGFQHPLGFWLADNQPAFRSGEPS
jgi:hypothetical protein